MSVGGRKPKGSHKRLEALVLGGLFKTRLIKTMLNCAQHRNGGYEWRRSFFGLANASWRVTALAFGIRWR